MIRPPPAAAARAIAVPDALTVLIDAMAVHTVTAARRGQLFPPPTAGHRRAPGARQ